MALAFFFVFGFDLVWFGLSEWVCGGGDVVEKGLRTGRWGGNNCLETIASGLDVRFCVLFYRFGT